MAGNRVSRGQSPIGMSRGSASRAGSVYGKDPYAVPGEAYRVALNSPDNIEKERKYAALHLALKKEFMEADINKDGRLKKEELV